MFDDAEEVFLITFTVYSNLDLVGFCAHMGEKVDPSSYWEDCGGGGMYLDSKAGVVRWVVVGWGDLELFCEQLHFIFVVFASEVQIFVKEAAL